jgi:hypothetical protein
MVREGRRADIRDRDHQHARPVILPSRPGWDEDGRSARAVRVPVVAKGFGASAFTPSRPDGLAASEKGAGMPRANKVANVSDPTNAGK